VDLTSLTREVLTNRLEGVLLWLDPKPAASCIQHLRAAGYVGKVAGPGWLRCPEFEEAAGSLIETFISPTTICDTATAARLTDFADAFRLRFQHDPDPVAAMSYDAAQLLIEILQCANGRPAHTLFPLDFSLPGVTGVLSFDSQGNRKARLELQASHTASSSNRSTATKQIK